MTLRAVIFGIMLGLVIAAVTYFNDAVVHQTYLIGSLLPIGVFGVLALLLMANMAVRYFGTRWPIRPSELAVITAIALAVCGWPGSGFFRAFTTDLAMPAQLIKNNVSWQADHVMSYVPGGSPLLGDGHVRDWPALAKRLAEAGRPDAPAPEAKVWQLLPDAARSLILELARTGQVEDSVRPDLLKGLNHVIGNPEFYRTFPADRMPETARALMRERTDLAARREALDSECRDLAKQRDRLAVEKKEPLAALERERAALLASHDTSAQGAAKLMDVERRVNELLKGSNALNQQIQQRARTIQSLDRRIGSGKEIGKIEAQANRLLLVSLYPDQIAPPPEGDGVLLAGGEPDPFAVDTLQLGWHGDKRLGVTDLPWDAWWPTLEVWGSMAILIGIAALCMALVVHPQWSHRELLSYPIARFVEEVTRPTADGRESIILKSRMFWYGFGALLAIHLVNGLNAWFPETFFIRIPLSFDLSSIGEVFPTVSKVTNGWGVLYPPLYLSLVAFAYFLSSEVSFSIGVSNVVWVVVAGLLISNGVPIEHEYIGGKNLNLLLFGAYLGSALMILYIGRRYYLNVAASAAGLPRRADTSPYATWAARGLVVCTVLAVLVLTQAGLDWPLSVLVVLLVLALFLVVTRINAETGVIFVEPFWWPVGVITVLLGIQAISPQAYVVMALASVILVGGPREAIMPYLVNGLRLAESSAGAPPRRMAPLLLLMIVAGFVVALVATLLFQYNLGFNFTDIWATQWMPSRSFQMLTAHIDALNARGDLAHVTGLRGLDSLSAMSPQGKDLLWFGIGAALVIGCSVARLRLSWWYIHPVLFLLWGTWSCPVQAASFLMGWATKTVLVQLGGEKTYQSAKPFMIGVIAGELTACIGWTIVGAIYYMATNRIPVTYRILPG